MTDTRTSAGDASHRMTKHAQRVRKAHGAYGARNEYLHDELPGKRSASQFSSAARGVFRKLMAIRL
jgi:hypothetical protein